jgi:low affinity Fe/Cu permease
MNHNDLLLLLAGSFLPNNLIVWLYRKVFPTRRIVHKNKQANTFTKLAVWCGDKFGSPTNFIMWIVIIGVWIYSGHLFHYNNTWQLLINTPTTIIELFAAILIQYVGNRIERRQANNEDHMIHLLEKIESLDKKIEAKVDTLAEREMVL